MSQDGRILGISVSPGGPVGDDRLDQRFGRAEDGLLEVFGNLLSVLAALAFDGLDGHFAVGAGNEVGGREEAAGGREGFAVVGLQAGGQVEFETGTGRALPLSPDETEPLAGDQNPVAEVGLCPRERLGQEPVRRRPPGVQILVPVSDVRKQQGWPAGGLVASRAVQRVSAPLAGPEVKSEDVPEQRAGEQVADRWSIVGAPLGTIVQSSKGAVGSVDLARHQGALASGGPTEYSAQVVVGEKPAPVAEVGEERHQRSSGTRKSAPSGRGGTGSSTWAKASISSRRAPKYVSTAARLASML